eukprot:15050087-Alexandrium_andersonii.AAC.1
MWLAARFSPVLTIRHRPGAARSARKPPGRGGRGAQGRRPGCRARRAKKALLRTPLRTRPKGRVMLKRPRRGHP